MGTRMGVINACGRIGVYYKDVLLQPNQAGYLSYKETLRSWTITWLTHHPRQPLLPLRRNSGIEPWYCLTRYLPQRSTHWTQRRVVEPLVIGESTMLLLVVFKNYYNALKDWRALLRLGMDRLSEDDKLVVYRARKINVSCHNLSTLQRYSLVHQVNTYQSDRKPFQSF